MLRVRDYHELKEHWPALMYWHERELEYHPATHEICRAWTNLFLLAADLEDVEFIHHYWRKK